MTIKLSVPLLPESVNNYWKQKRGGGRYITAKGSAFKKLVKQHVFFKRLGVGRKRAKYTLFLILFSPKWITKSGTIKNVDLDNFLKNAVDAIAEALSISDSQFFELQVFKKPADKDSTYFELAEIGE